MATQVQARDAMQFINEQNAATVERFIERLEFRARDPTFTAYREAYLKLLDLPRAEAVLDLGCGTGVVTRAIAARDGFAGTVTGIAPDVQNGLRVGDRVCAGLPSGGFAEEAVVDADNVFAIPDALDFAAATLFPTIYATAYAGLVWRAALAPYYAELGLDQNDERPEAATPGVRETSMIARQEGDHVPSG